MRVRRALAAAAVLPLALGIAACAPESDDDSSTASDPAGSSSTSESADACATDSLPLRTAGQLTVGTDSPAYDPWFVDNDPSNGKGFESAVAYAVADRLGFSADQVTWVKVPFNKSYAPGPKDFDFDINQISITPQRAKRVDFSEPYFTAPQAVIAPEGSPAQDATTLADLADKTIGVQVGTTSLEAVEASIKPTKDPQVFNDSNDVTRALENGRVDAAVVDLPTAFYLTAAELENSKIVGQFAAPGGDEWGMLLERGSKLTSCIDKAVKTLAGDGTLKRLQDQYMGGNAAPELR
jgi:polar amino acid transport system substrate-binding protein